MLMLNQLQPLVARSNKRVGRGYGSGKGGHTAGRGQKGQKSRAGGSIPVWFEGGQLPLIKRLPMLRGKGRFSVVRKVQEIRLGELNQLPTTTITLDTLKLAKLISHRTQRVKIIPGGKLEKAIAVKGLKVTKSVQSQIEKAGGSVEPA